MEVNIKRLTDTASIPEYAKPGDAGMDLIATSVEYDKVYDIVSYRTGVAVEIPEGYVGLIFPRSSIYKKDLALTNSVGVIDSGYRGEISCKFKPIGDFWSIIDNQEEALEQGNLHVYLTAEDKERDLGAVLDVYSVGERIAQLVILPYPQITFREVKELSETNRGSDGFGSTGN